MSAFQTITGATLDLVILAVIFVVLAGYGFYFGKNKLTAFVVAFYAALLLYSNFPYAGNITFLNGVAREVVFAQVVVFLVFFALVNFILLKVFQSDFSFSRTSRLLEVGLLALSATILVLVFWHHAVPLVTVHSFSPMITSLFASGTAFFWWLLVPLGGVFIANR